MMLDPLDVLRTAPKGTDEFREAVLTMIESGRIDKARRVLDDREQAEEIRGMYNGLQSPT